MASVQETLNHPAATDEKRSKDWRNVIWREWRNCDDEDYARHLFELVIDKPVDGRGILILILSTTILGGLGGWLLAQLLYPEKAAVNWGLWAVAGVVIGGTLGLLLVWISKLTSNATWRFWLPGLLPNKVIDATKTDGWNSPLLGLIVVLAGGMGVGITGALFFGQSNTRFYLFLVLLVVVIGVGYYLNQTPDLIRGVVTAIVGMLLGLFFGLGFAQLVGMTIGPLDVDNSGRVVGLAVGVTVGILLGRRAGLLGLLLCQVILMFIMIQTPPFNVVLLGYLVGILGGGLVGSLSRMLLPAGPLTFDDVYGYRKICLWWWQRPYFTEVEAALNKVSDKPAWLDRIFNQTKASQERQGTLTEYIPQLNHADWIERVVARQMIASLGGEAMAELQTVANEEWNRLCKQASWLMQNIAHDTQTRLAKQTSELVCPTCITRFDSHTVKVSWRSVKYYGCRTCGQSRMFEHYPQGIVAVLDANHSKRQAQNGTLRVNWLDRREPFDFDWVEIVNATDEDVERFAVQVGNDTDAVRDSRYTSIPCYVTANCQLSDNTLRILEKTFAGVEKSMP